MQSLRSSLFRGVRATQMRSVAPARRMGAHAKPEYTGIEAKVRAFLPENYHLVYAVLGGYAALITFLIVKGGFDKEAEIKAMPAPEVPDYHTVIPKSDDIPGFGTPEWEAFIESNIENFEVWLTSKFNEPQLE